MARSDPFYKSLFRGSIIDRIISKFTGSVNNITVTDSFHLVFIFNYKINIYTDKRNIQRSNYNFEISSFYKYAYFEESISETLSDIH